MFTLSPLPYAPDALAPHISEKTVQLHYGKHHQSYVDKLNKLIANDVDDGRTLEAVILDSADQPAKQPVFNSAAQIWNHDFYWKSLVAKGGGEPTGELAVQLADAFASTADFKTAFVEAGKAHFGSGWLWLVLDGSQIKIVTTHDADLPLAHGWTALITCDLWEHAYYVDYEDRRAEYIEMFLDHLANWDFANANLQAARVSENA